ARQQALHVDQYYQPVVRRKLHRGGRVTVEFLGDRVLPVRGQQPRPGRIAGQRVQVHVVTELGGLNGMLQRRRITLLHHVREVVGKDPPPGWRRGGVLPLAEDDMRAHCERAGGQHLRGGGRRAVHVDAHVIEEVTRGLAAARRSPAAHHLVGNAGGLPLRGSVRRLSPGNNR